MVNYRDNSNEGYENEPLEASPIKYLLPKDASVILNEEGEAYVPWPTDELNNMCTFSTEHWTTPERTMRYTGLFEASIKHYKRPPISGELWELQTGPGIMQAFMYVKVTAHKFLLIGGGCIYRCVWTPPRGCGIMQYRDLWWPEMFEEYKSR